MKKKVLDKSSLIFIIAVVLLAVLSFTFYEPPIGEAGRIPISRQTINHTQNIFLLKAPARNYMEQIYQQNEATKSYQKAKEEEGYCAEAKAQAQSRTSGKGRNPTTEIYSYCLDLDGVFSGGEDFKIASSAYAYTIFQTGSRNPIEECVVEYDTCKEEGLPFMYEAICSGNNSIQSSLLNCQEVFGLDYTCVSGACVPSVCGDSKFNPTNEECDDGNNEEGDGCSATCQLEYCGDNNVNNNIPDYPEEQCDNGENNGVIPEQQYGADQEYCTTECILEEVSGPLCGDGIIQEEEQCDDGSHCSDGTSCTSSEECMNIGDWNCLPRDFDGCSFNCKLEGCGDGLLQIGEECDDLNQEDFDGCSSGCKVEFCGNNIIDSIAEECDDGNNVPLDGCSSECLLELPPPDLYVGEIFSPVHSAYCINSYHFEICNAGEGFVEEEFQIKVEVNGQESIFDYGMQEGMEIQPGGCLHYYNPIKLHILKFGLDLESTDEIHITLDVNDDIKEPNEADNEKLGESYSGDQYIYEGDIECTTWCYDSDDGKSYFDSGKLTYLYEEVDHQVDECDSGMYPNQAILTEYYCLNPIYQLDNGLFPYPALSKKVDCTILDAKCVDGECVPIDENHLSCKDLEGKLDIWTYGEVDYTTIDGENIILKDTCQDEEHIKEVYCDSDELADDYTQNCVYQNALCQDGKCVEVNETNWCEDLETGGEFSLGDPYVYGITEFHKFTGTVDIKKDKCSFDRTEVRQYYCELDFPESQWYDCTNDENEHGAALCHDGICVLPDPDYLSCDEWGDDGLDYYNQGTVESNSIHNVDDWNSDECIPMTNLLIEYYCAGNEFKMTPPYNCGLEGMACNEGKCVAENPNLVSCEETEWDEIEYVNKFGEENWEGDECVADDDYDDWETESNTLKHWFCNENTPDYETIDCSAEGKVCHYGECITNDPALISCTEDSENNKVKYTNGYGNKYSETDQCVADDDYDDWEKESNTLQHWFCDEKVPDYKITTCSEGKCVWGECLIADLELIFCELGDFGQIHSADEYGLESWNSPHCVEDDDYDDWEEESNTLKNYICDGNKPVSSIVDCSLEGKKCYDGECLLEDFSQIACVDSEEDPLDPFVNGNILYTNEFGVNFFFDDNCDYGTILEESYCDGNELEEIDIDCADFGMGCNTKKDICQEADYDLYGCQETDNGDFPEIPSFTSLNDEYGNGEWAYEFCETTTKVMEFYCEGIDDVEEEFNICEEEKVCKGLCNQEGEYLGAACVDPENTEYVVCGDSDETGLKGLGIEEIEEEEPEPVEEEEACELNECLNQQYAGGVISCGIINDNCGGTIDCGSCPGTSTCSEMGICT
jgi:cysteine-rich repeat protein